MERIDILRGIALIRHQSLSDVEKEYEGVEFEQLEEPTPYVMSPNFNAPNIEYLDGLHYDVRNGSKFYNSRNNKRKHKK